MSSLEDRLESLRLEARELAFNERNNSASIEKFEEALQEFEQGQYSPSRKAEILVDMAYPTRMESDNDAARALLDKAASFSEDGTFYTSGLIAEERAIIINYSYKNEENKKEALQEALSQINEALSKYELAQTNSSNEIRSIPEIQDKIKRATGIKSVVYSNLAQITEDLEEKELYLSHSERFALEEISLREAADEVGKGIQNAYHTLGHSYVNSNRFNEAESLLKRAVSAANDQATEAVAAYLNYELAVNSYKQAGELQNNKTDEYVSELMAEVDLLPPAWIEATKGEPGWNSIMEMASEELKPRIEEFYAVLKK
ncbi:hypothetical protein BVX95_00740 [archaeon D22]|nr:hypothetical protein BVX95_00740 [archaeon D22]